MPEQFSTRLRELREQAGLTQEGLARKANVSTATVVKLERKDSDKDPAWSTVLALADALGVSLEAFRVQATEPATTEKPEKPKRKRGK